jgi:hypothetical protein
MKLTKYDKNQARYRNSHIFHTFKSREWGRTFLKIVDHEKWIKNDTLMRTFGNVDRDL